MATSPVVIIVPVYRKTGIEEHIALTHLKSFLNEYMVYFIAPEGMNLDWLQAENVVRFPEEYFQNTQTYSNLLITKNFYKKFSAYDFMLVYQLDCLVFSNQIKQWLLTGYDYIGAPLFLSNTNPKLKKSRVGNGGFSLRKVASFLNVLNSKHTPSWKDILNAPLPDLLDIPLKGRLIKRLKVLREARLGVGWYTQHYSLNEDRFWSDRAKLFYPQFKIAPVQTGLRFSFERFPRYCFEQNNRQLPFGCHAWAKWERDFWEPHLIKESYSQ